MKLYKQIILSLSVATIASFAYFSFTWLSITDLSLEPINAHVTPEFSDPDYKHRLPITLISYADGHEVFYQNQNFLMYSGLNKGIDQFILYKRNMLDVDFYNKNKHILSEKIGAGLWLWKPQIILQTMKKMPENSIIIYMDSGFAMMRDIRPILKLIEKNDILIAEDGGKSPSPYLEKIASPELLKTFNINLSSGEHLTPLWAAFVVVKNTPRARVFMEKWLSYCEQKELITHFLNDQILLGLLAYTSPDGVHTIPEPKISHIIEWHHRKSHDRVNSSLLSSFNKHYISLQRKFIDFPIIIWMRKIIISHAQNMLIKNEKKYLDKLGS